MTLTATRRPSTHLEAPSEAASGRARPRAALHQRVLVGRISTPTAMETLTRHFESRVDASLERTGLKPSTFGLQAVGYLNLVRQLRPGRSPETGDGLSGPRVHRSLPPGPCGPCSLPGQRAPEFFTEQNGGRPMTRAMEQGMDAPARVLRLPRVQTRTGLARSTIYVRVADGSFPQPIRLGARAVGWIESEVDAWIREQIAASRSSAE